MTFVGREQYTYTQKRVKWWEKYKHKQHGKHEKTNVKFNLSRFKWSNPFVYYYILLKGKFWIREKTRSWVNLTLKKNKKASKIVQSYVLTQMFLSLKCCRKKSKITDSSLTVTFLTRKRAFLLQNRINESLNWTQTVSAKINY